MNLDERFEAIKDAVSALETTIKVAADAAGCHSAKECHDKLEEHRQLNDQAWIENAAHPGQMTPAFKMFCEARDKIDRNLVVHLYGSYNLLDEVNGGRHDGDIIVVLNDSNRALKAAME